MNRAPSTVWILAGLLSAAPVAMAQGTAQTPSPATPPAQTTAQPRPTPPTRDPNTPGYVTAKELPDGAIPPADADGNFIIGPTHNRCAGDDRAGRRAAGNDLQLHDELGRQQDLSRHRARRRARSAPPIPADPAKLVVTTSHPAPYTRKRGGLRAEAICRRARPRRSSSAPTDPTSCCSPRSTT